MQYKVLALDLDGTLTNSDKIITPRTKAALQAAAQKGVCIVLASGRPTVGIEPLAKELELEKYGGCILSYNGGKIIDCQTGQTLVQHAFPADLIESVGRPFHDVERVRATLSVRAFLGHDQGDPRSPVRGNMRDLR